MGSARAVLLTSENSKSALPQCFQIGQNQSCHTHLENLYCLPISCCILFEYKNFTILKPYIHPTSHLSSLIKSSILTHGNSISFLNPLQKGHTQPCSCHSCISLPIGVRSKHTISSFRHQIKTYLFRLDYPSPLSTSPIRYLLA